MDSETIKPKQFSILGSTGSIGQQTLDVVANFKEKFSIVGLTAGKNLDLFKTQLVQFTPQIAAVADPADIPEIKEWVTSQRLATKVVGGPDGLVEVATHPDNQLLVSAIVGTASLIPTYEALKKNIPIGLACKEVLVAAGDLFMAAAAQSNTPVLPIDSEHAAIKQCLAGPHCAADIGRITLTASGGPFFKTDPSEFDRITPKDALKHPNWEMGAKITIDSATMMNKGLEVIEAHHLFNVPFDQIDTVIHPQSIIHSFVEFSDGNILAHLGLPDMRFPIQFVLTYPEKWQNPWPKAQLHQLEDLQFFKPDLEKFSLLKLAYEAGRQGGTAPVVLNAANEAAVQLFLDGKLSFKGIMTRVKQTVDQFDHFDAPTLDQIIAIDRQVKKSVSNVV